MVTTEPTMMCPFPHKDDDFHGSPDIESGHPKDFPCGDRGAVDDMVIVADAVKWVCLKVNESYKQP